MNRGFTLPEVMITAFIAFLMVLASLSIFDRANVAALGQDRLVYTNAALRSSANGLTNAIQAAGFGMRTAADYSLRPYDNVPSVTPNLFPSLPVALLGGAFTQPAKLNSDALLTIHSDSTCERLVLDTSSLPAIVPGNNATFNACLPQSRCILTQNNLGNPLAPPQTLTAFDNTVLLVINETPPQTQQLAFRVTGAATIQAATAGICGGTANYLQLTGKSTGLQISSNYYTGGGQPIGRIIHSHFYYLGNNRRLYDLPLTYFMPGENQEDRGLADSVDSFQLRYHPWNDLTLTAGRNGCPDSVGACAAGTGIIDGPADIDGIPQVEEMRLVEFALIVRGEKEDNDFKNQGTYIQLFNDPTTQPKDSYRRRLVREQVLARNLQYFRSQTVTY